MIRRTPLLAVALVAWVVASANVIACPFCPSDVKSLSEEMKSVDVVVVARLTHDRRPSGGTNEVQVAASTFSIVEIFKGAEHLSGVKSIDTILIKPGNDGGLFLILGLEPANVLWSTPLPFSQRAQQYLREIAELPNDLNETARLKFFQDYLEHNDPVLATDAFHEFARAPYESITALAPAMNHEQLVRWIRHADIPATRRRLYLTMLGVCGTADDLPWLEGMIRSDDRRQKAGLDALIACYLSLRGPAGMPLVEELYLANDDADYSDVYAAIMALRFHGDQPRVPRARLLAALHHVLREPALADLVIPDLARWEDWSAVDRLVELFKTSDGKTSWVRVPVINYLRKCPLPEAKQKIAELAKIDPDAVRRASIFFPTPPPEE